MAKFICFCSSRGGVGKTTLAWKLAQDMKRRGKVCVVEVDVIEPSFRYMLKKLDLPPMGVGELVQWLTYRANRDDSEEVTKKIQAAKVEYQGVSLFVALGQESASLWFGLMGAVSFGQLRPSFKALFSQVKSLGFDWVIVDCPPQMRELSIAAILALPPHSKVVHVASTLVAAMGALNADHLNQLLRKQDRNDLFPFVLVMNRLRPPDMAQFHQPSSARYFLDKHGVDKLDWVEEIVGIPWAEDLEQQPGAGDVSDGDVMSALRLLASAVSL